MAFQSLCFPSVNEDKNLFYFTELLQGLNEIMHIKLFIRHLASSKYSINHSCSKTIILSTILAHPCRRELRMGKVFKNEGEKFSSLVFLRQRRGRSPSG